jgi:hypothetical protein
MAQVDWSDPHEATLDEGIYLVEIVRSEEKPSSKGDAMFKVELRAVAFREKLCDDFIMLAGNGRGVGQAKLKALGFGPDSGEIRAGDLVARRVYASAKSEIYRDKRQLKVARYWPESAKPEGVREPDPNAVVEDDCAF